MMTVYIAGIKDSQFDVSNGMLEYFLNNCLNYNIDFENLKNRVELEPYDLAERCRVFGLELFLGDEQARKEGSQVSRNVEYEREEQRLVGEKGCVEIECKIDIDRIKSYKSGFEMVALYAWRNGNKPVCLDWGYPISNDIMMSSY